MYTPLNGTWELRDEILSCGLAQARRIGGLAEGWIPQPVPGDIHQGLAAAGRIADPLLGLNSFDCRWTEDRSWWFRKRFPAEAAWQEADVVELELDGLDANAEIFLNGVHLGAHRNAFRPFVADVKPYLLPGENVLLVRLTAGVETFSDLDVDAPNGVRAWTEAIHGHPERGDPRRVLVRKPQYAFGWDWSPRLATTAIASGAKLSAMREACIRHVALHPIHHGEDEVLVRATVTVDRFHYYQTGQGTVSLTLTDAQGRRFRAQRQVLLRSGYNFVELTVPIKDPQLWWPNGLGAQHLYRVEAELETQAGHTTYPAFDYGLRFVELDTQDTFAMVINGKRVFCKGANWIPADALYARVDDARYEALIREAQAANFNMLRVWGGGLYERDAFYRACDRYGIMVWQDFTFACAPYPDHLPWFRAEVEKEADHQTKRLRHHASLVLWCGNNENAWGFCDWWHEQTHGGAWIYNYLLPETVRRNCPEIPYWNSSPYGGEKPNSSQVGDRHAWEEGMMNADMAQRITTEAYDRRASLFVSEFGYVGAPVKETVLAYLDGASPDRRGATWQHHTNAFEQDTVEAGIRKHYVDPETLDLDGYLLYSGLCQGLMYGYALESMRHRPECHGSLFWMYADCWGEVGWTIVDYNLRRKPSWYFVRRAYAPVRLILRAAGEAIRVVAANDSPEPVSMELEYGYVSLDGKLAEMETRRVEVPALARTELCTFPRGSRDPTQGLWMARPLDRPEILPAVLRAVDHRQLKLCDPGLSLTAVKAATAVEEQGATVAVSAQAYAHAVHLVLPAGVLPSDDYFDLLPGETRQVRIVASEPFDPAAIGVTSIFDHFVKG